jgi:hypothetical protein
MAYIASIMDMHPNMGFLDMVDITSENTTKAGRIMI